MSRQVRALPALALAAVLCLVTVAPVHGATLRDVARSPYTCSTSALAGLSQQIIDCMSTKVGVRFTCLSTTYVRPTSASATPCFQEGMSNALKRAANAKGEAISINSGLRTPAQQLMLYIHREQGVCGQTNPVALPGKSNHNGGLAVDVKWYDYWKSTLENNGFKWYGSRDKVHFTYQYGDRTAASKMLKAFQILYNMNGGNLVEDGVYGANTRAALEASPADGFSKTCSQYRAEAGEDGLGNEKDDGAPAWRTPVIAGSAAAVALIAGVVIGVFVVAKKRAVANKQASDRAEMQQFENMKSNLVENQAGVTAESGDTATAV